IRLTRVSGGLCDIDGDLGRMNHYQEDSAHQEIFHKNGPSADSEVQTATFQGSHFPGCRFSTGPHQIGFAERD
ncbi:MAG: hypothetical protein AAF989_06435, partial [Planctomycetota bacterium]